MTRQEKEQLDRLLSEFENYLNDCEYNILFMQEHNFNIEKQVYDIKRSAYRDCYRDLKALISKVKVND